MYQVERIPCLKPYQIRRQLPRPSDARVDLEIWKAITSQGYVSSKELAQSWGCPEWWISIRIKTLRRRNQIMASGDDRYVLSTRGETLKRALVRMLRDLPWGEGMSVCAIARALECSGNLTQRLLRQLGTEGVVEQLDRASWGYRYPLTPEELATPEINWSFVAHLREMESRERAAAEKRPVDPFYIGSADRYIRCIHRYRSLAPLREEIEGEAAKTATSPLPRKTALPNKERVMKAPWVEGAILKTVGSPAFCRESDGEARPYVFWESTGQPRWDGRRWHCYMRPLGSDRGFEERTLNRFRRTRWTGADYRADAKRVLADLKREWV